jgi:phosphoribosylanthranilate isomerase
MIMVKVKICGITSLEDALCAQDAGADFLGFVFAESPRRISPEKAKYIIRDISPSVKITALFVNEKKEVVDDIIGALGRVDLLQFHGEEPPAYCRYFTGRKIIKALRVKDEQVIRRIRDFNDVDFVLLDSYSEKAYGGTGKGIDLNSALKAKEYGIPIFLSGGLNPGNVKEAVERIRPFCVDVSSGVEKQPGIKDHALIKGFIKSAKG